MRKKITLTIDEDVYSQLHETPKGVSLSDVATFFFKVFLEEMKKVHELSQKKFDDLFNACPEDLALRLRIRKYIKPYTVKIEKKMNQIESALSPKKLRKYRRQK